MKVLKNILLLLFLKIVVLASVLGGPLPDERASLQDMAGKMTPGDINFLKGEIGDFSRITGIKAFALTAYSPNCAAFEDAVKQTAASLGIYFNCDTETFSAIFDQETVDKTGPEGTLRSDYQAEAVKKANRLIQTKGLNSANLSDGFQSILNFLTEAWRHKKEGHIPGAEARESDITAYFEDQRIPKTEKPSTSVRVVTLAQNDFYKSDQSKPTGSTLSYLQPDGKSIRLDKPKFIAFSPLKGKDSGLYKANGYLLAFEKGGSIYNANFTQRTNTKTGESKLIFKGYREQSTTTWYTEISPNQEAAYAAKADENQVCFTLYHHKSLHQIQRRQSYSA